ncbi:MAG TPA: GNAT family N-acetyltransferase [Actinomycetota bacterium]|nr:GNAT family N-acetyltransferase [Actinomycetota bacterium]
MDVEIRKLERERVAEAVRMLFVAFGDLPRQREVDLEERVLGEGTWYGALDGEAIVGSAAHIPLRMTVPGSELTLGAVTSVGVLPTHRRRGVLTALMRRQLDDLRGAELAVAGLWASEAGIYLRFGYGHAIPAASFSIERPYNAFSSDVPTSGRVRLIERDDAIRQLAPIYDRVRLERPGFLERDEKWWEYLLEHHHDEKQQAAYFALHEGADGPDGYARYRIERKWAIEGPRSVLEVDEVVAATDDAYAALWRYVLDVDLVHTVRGENHPTDEPLFHMLREPRRLGFSLRDGLWLRLVDVPTALASRRYRAGGRLVVEVRDGFCPGNDGRFELEGDRDGATCRETDRDPDLVCDVRDLGAAFMGGVPVTTLVRAGRVVEETDGAALRTDAMFAWDRTPWCSHVF